MRITSGIFKITIQSTNSDNPYYLSVSKHSVKSITSWKDVECDKISLNGTIIHVPHGKGAEIVSAVMANGIASKFELPAIAGVMLIILSGTIMLYTDQLGGKAKQVPATANYCSIDPDLIAAADQYDRDMAQEQLALAKEVDKTPLINSLQSKGVEKWSFTPQHLQATKAATSPKRGLEAFGLSIDKKGALE